MEDRTFGWPLIATGQRAAAGDQVAEHQLGHDDIVCEYPQSGAR